MILSLDNSHKLIIFIYIFFYKDLNHVEFDAGEGIFLRKMSPIQKGAGQNLEFELLKISAIDSFFPVENSL